MRTTKTALTFLLVAVVILFAGNSLVYGKACPVNLWGIDPDPPRGDTWTGTLFISFEIVEGAGLPSQMNESTPSIMNIQGHDDYVTKGKFFLKLESRKEFMTFSGEGYTMEPVTLADGTVVDKVCKLFYLNADYCSLRFRRALHNFLENSVYPNLPGGPYSGGSLTEVTETHGNVEAKLYGTLAPGIPVYYSAKIAVVVY